MTFFPNIKYVISGDESVAGYYRKFATNQLAILERQMSFQDLKMGRRVVSPINGVLVECISRYSYKEVRIFVSSYNKESEQELLDVTEENEKVFEEESWPLIYICGVQPYPLYPTSSSWDQPHMQLVSTGKDSDPSTGKELEPFSSWGKELFYYGDYYLFFRAGRYQTFKPIAFLQLKYAGEVIELPDESVMNVGYTIALSGIGSFDRVRVTVSAPNTLSTLPEEYEDFKALRLIIMPGGLGQSQNRTVRVTEALQVSVFDYIGSSSYSSISANLSQDKKKLYIYDSGVGMIYSRRIVSGRIEYILFKSFTVTPPYSVDTSNTYIDTDGVLYLGVSYDLIANPGYDSTLVFDGHTPHSNPFLITTVTPYIKEYSYWQIDLNTEEISETDTGSKGTTIVDGELVPIEWIVVPRANTSFWAGESWESNIDRYEPNDLLGSGSTSVTAYPTQAPSCQLGGAYVSSSIISHVDSSWTSGYPAYHHREYSSTAEFYCTNCEDVIIFGEAYFAGYSSEGSYSASGVVDSADPSLNQSSFEGTYSNSNNLGPKRIGPSVYTEVSLSSSYPLTSGGSLGTGVDTYVLPDIIYPLSILNAEYLRGFIIRDNNINDNWPNGITIAGNYYNPTLVDSETGALIRETPAWQIELNGVQVQDTVFFDEVVDGVRKRNTLFTKNQFRHFGFLF